MRNVPLISNKNISNQKVKRKEGSKSALLWLCFISICFAVLIKQTLFQQTFPIETNILALLPENQQDTLAQTAFEKIAKNLNNKVVFLVEADDKKTLSKAATAFSQQLLSTQIFANIDAQLTGTQQQAWGQLYFPYRSQLLTPDQKLRLEKSPEDQVTQVIQQVYNPFSGVTGGELESDPFLLFRDYLSSKNTNSANFELYDGYITTEHDGKFYVIIQASLAKDAYDLTQQSLLPSLLALEKSVEKSFNVKLLHTGTMFYAAYGTQSAIGEISTIGVGSLIGIILLLLFVYRSALPLTLALLSIGCGLLVAFVVSVAIFGKVHLFSLVFGASLIGVSIDYAFHFLTERLLTKNNWDSKKSLKHIFNAITLGLITSLIGYLGLLIAPFPGLQQLSLFSVVGLLAAYLTVIFCYPYLAKSPSKTPEPNLSFLKHWLNLWNNKRLRIGLPLLFLVFSGLGLNYVFFDDDIRQLQAMPEDLKQQEKQIKTITGVGEGQQTLLLTAHSEELLLIELDKLGSQLAAWKAENVIMSYQSIGQFVPSIKAQKENYQLVKSLYENQGDPLQRKLNLSDPVSAVLPFKPLLMSDYLASSVSESLRFLWLGDIEKQTATIVVLGQVNNQQKVDQFIALNSNLSHLDKADEISAIFATYRVYILELLIGAYLLISLLLLWRYGLKLGFKVILPPLIAGCVGLAVTSVLGIPITIFNLLALILILGIGIDYTLFFAELKTPKTASNTLLAITLSAITTVLSFGLLALSETAAIHGFGVTVLTGIIVAWILAPLAMRREINQ